MADVIQFQRYQDVTGWDLFTIREWLRQQGWKGVKIHVPQKDGEPVLLERLPG